MASKDEQIHLCFYLISFKINLILKKISQKKLLFHLTTNFPCVNVKSTFRNVKIYEKTKNRRISSYRVESETKYFKDQKHNKPKIKLVKKNF